LVHACFAALAAFPMTHENRAADWVKLTLAQRKRLADP
jgi:hypothetical protein